MRKLTFAVLVACGGGATLPGAALAQEACTIHEVKRGDTLRKISKAALGTDDFIPLFEANRDILRSPDLIELGDLLRIPCPDGTLPERPVIVEGEVVEPETEVAALPDPEPAAPTRIVPVPAAPTRTAVSGPVRILTASGFAPFVDESGLDQGMFTDMVTSSYTAAGGTRPPIVFVNDRGAHLRDLVVTGAFGLAYPWVQPDCATVESWGRIAPTDALLCDGFAFSNPLYQVQEAVYVRAADANIPITNRRVCRAEGENISGLVSAGLVSGADQVVLRATFLDCLSALIAGEVDLVPHDTASARRILDDNGLSSAIVAADGVALPVTYHMIAAEDDPAALEALGTLDEGLGELQRTGAWFALVAKHLAE